ncbi:hypothetical protein N789_09215 [Arenimonas oryziterrae DSM 21050 = YC6267]|uniref:Uncharacterized protein n=1 Tax=Arenimonas oryziterrae DSM 21050 = YC6267 TaxID=1121015 RepID=A0A091AXV6_9GAMM|nr:hypothetical protein N789_09215 [Arenimonas oryziterrae DSM 21050 = YC6267]
MNDALGGPDPQLSGLVDGKGIDILVGQTMHIPCFRQKPRQLLSGFAAVAQSIQPAGIGPEPDRVVGGLRDGEDVVAAD